VRRQSHRAGHFSTAPTPCIKLHPPPPYTSCGQANTVLLLLPSSARGNHTLSANSTSKHFAQPTASHPSDPAQRPCASTRTQPTAPHVPASGHHPLTAAPAPSPRCGPPAPGAARARAAAAVRRTPSRCRGRCSTRPPARVKRGEKCEEARPPNTLQLPAPRACSSRSWGGQWERGASAQTCFSTQQQHHAR